MARVLITGIDGFTGRFLAARLTSAGHEVHGLAFRAMEKIAGTQHIHTGDLLDRDALTRIVAEVLPDHVVHLAAIAFVGHGDVAAIYATNIVGTRNLLEALVASRLPVQSVLIASSANVYGNATEGAIAESASAAPANDYAVSKLAMEYTASLYRAKLPITIVRPFNYTGVGQSELFLLPKIVGHIRRKAEVIELGNLHVARDFSDVRDVVEAYARLLSSEKAVGGTFNVCSGEAYSLHQVLTMAQEIARHAIDVQVNPAFVRENEVKVLKGDPSKLDAAIGARQKIALRDTLRWMLEFDA